MVISRNYAGQFLDCEGKGAIFLKKGKIREKYTKKEN